MKSTLLIRPFLFLVLTVALAPFAALADAEIVYVNPAKAQLKSAPKMNASVIQELPRGTSLKVLKKDGIWLEVSAAPQAGKADTPRSSGRQVTDQPVTGQPVTGWISKLFVSPNKPVGDAELTHLASDKNLGKASRRRVSSYNVSASTRGLTAGKRGREGREKYQSDQEAVEKMEKLSPTDAEVRNFKKNGKLAE